MPNVSEGRDRAVLDDLRPVRAARRCSTCTRDADHHRSVFTLAGPGARPTRRPQSGRSPAPSSNASTCGPTRASIRGLGVLDVVPFVALDEPPSVGGRRRAVASPSGSRSELGVPVFLYDDADPLAARCPTYDATRSAARTRLRAARAGPRTGAAAVGARPPLVAVNCWLDRDDLALARSIAHEVRERDGGLPGVRALGFRLGSVGVAQVSMNLVDLAATGIEPACTEVRRAARSAPARRSSPVELVGLVPAAEHERWSDGFRAWTGLTADVTIEARLADRRRS